MLLILICNVAHIVRTTKWEVAGCGRMEHSLQATEGQGLPSGLPMSGVCITAHVPPAL